MTTKTELLERISELEYQVENLEGDNTYLEQELFEAREPVVDPDFPRGISNTAAYVKKFNEMRHFKEI